MKVLTKNNLRPGFSENDIKCSEYLSALLNEKKVYTSMKEKLLENFPALKCENVFDYKEDDNGLYIGSPLKEMYSEYERTNEKDCFDNIPVELLKSADIVITNPPFSS